MKKAGTVPAFYSERIAQCERSNACRRAGFWQCPLLPHMRLMWVRLRRLVPGRSWCGMLWFWSKKQVVSSPRRAGSEAHTTGKNKPPKMLSGTFRGRWVVGGLNDRSTTAPRTLHRYLPSHGAVEARRYRMLESPGDADRFTTYVADVLARTEEVVGCR